MNTLNPIVNFNIVNFPLRNDVTYFETCAAIYRQLALSELNEASVLQWLYLPKREFEICVVVFIAHATEGVVCHVLVAVRSSTPIIPPRVTPMNSVVKTGLSIWSNLNSRCGRLLRGTSPNLGVCAPRGIFWNSHTHLSDHVAISVTHHRHKP